MAPGDPAGVMAHFDHAFYKGGLSIELDAYPVNLKQCTKIFSANESQQIISDKLAQICAFHIGYVLQECQCDSRKRMLEYSFCCDAAK